MRQNQKSCLSSKRQEHVRSFLVYLQRKQSTKLQRGLAWPCGDTAVPRMQPSITPSWGSHPPVRLCLSSPCPCEVRDQAAVQVSPPDLYLHTSWLLWGVGVEFFFCCGRCLGSRTNSGQSGQQPAAGENLSCSKTSMIKNCSFVLGAGE